MTGAEARVLELVRRLRVDPHAAEVAKELSKVSAALTAQNSPKRFTYNKLWWLITGAL
jgi:5'(3')-deoxyribonucleotidase